MVDMSMLSNAAFSGTPAPIASLRLPFQVRAVDPESQEMVKIRDQRVRSYGKHMPALAAKLGFPDDADSHGNCQIIGAFSKLDGSVLGSSRSHNNASGPLAMEASVTFPSSLSGVRLVETTRLCVSSNTQSSVVRGAMLKSIYWHAVKTEAEAIIVCARRPVDRMYEFLCFEDVFGEREFFPMRHGNNVEHRVMILWVDELERKWRAVGHPMYDLMFRERHDDLLLSGMNKGVDSWNETLWAGQRKSRIPDVALTA